MAAGPRYSLQEISDRLEINDLLSRYTFAIDNKDFDALDAVFTPDATIDYTTSGGIKGRYPEVKAWLAKALSMFPMTQQAQDLLMNAPSPANPKQLKELHLRVVYPEKQ